MIQRIAGLLSVLLCFSVSAQNSVSEADSLDFMSGDPFGLEQVVVTATRTQKKLKDVPVITQVISARQIAERGITNIQDLLQQEVPGLNFQEVGFGTDIDIQGLGSKHVLFLIDGERIAGENGGNIDYSRINMANVERIEIVKGASSALYGSQAMGGVINVITKNAKQKIELSGGIKYTGNNQTNYSSVAKDDPFRVHKLHLDKPNLNGNVNLGLKFGDFTMNTDVFYKSADAYQLYDKKGIVKYFPEYDITEKEEASTSPTSISGYEDIQVMHKMSYKFSRHFKLQLNGSYYQLNKYDFNQDNVFEQSRDYTYGGTAEYKFTENSILTAAFHADHYRRAHKFEKIKGDEMIYENTIMQPRVMYVNTALKNQTITGGWEFYRESLYGDKFETDEYQTKAQWYTTLFVQDDWSINKTYSLVAGLRGDYHQEYGFNVTPKVSLMAKWRPFIVRLNYARGYRSPTIKELYMNWDHLGMFQIIGNADLQPESNNYVSLSGEYSNRWINVTANVYGNWFRNKIEGIWKDGEVTNADGTVTKRDEFHYVNIGKSHLAGAEVMIKVKTCKYLNLHGTYNYLYTSKDDNGVKLSSASPHSGTVRAEFNSHVKNFGTVVNFTGNIMGSKNFHVMDEVEVNGETKEAYYEVNLGAFSMWNLTVSQDIYRYCRITLGINNIFDYTADRVTFNTTTSPGRKFFVACTLTL